MPLASGIARAALYAGRSVLNWAGIKKFGYDFLIGAVTGVAVYLALNLAMPAFAAGQTFGDIGGAMYTHPGYIPLFVGLVNAFTQSVVGIGEVARAAVQSVTLQQQTVTQTLAPALTVGLADLSTSLETRQEPRTYVMPRPEPQTRTSALETYLALQRSRTGKTFTEALQAENLRSEELSPTVTR